MHKLAILIVEYKTHDLTNKLVNQINYYDKDLYDLEVIDNSENNIGFDQAVIGWLGRVKVENYAGYWILNNDIELNINLNYMQKFLEYLKYDKDLGMITTQVADGQDCHMPQKEHHKVPMLVKYTDFQSVVLSRTFVDKFDLADMNYFFGGLDLDACIFCNRNDLKILIDYRYKVNHMSSKSFDVKEPLEDLKYYLDRNQIDYLPTLPFLPLNSSLIAFTLLNRYPDLQDRDFEPDMEKCTTLKAEYMETKPVNYADTEFNSGMSIFGWGTYEESKVFFKRALAAGKQEACSYLVGAGNYTYKYDDVSTALEPYVDRTSYEGARTSYEYSRAQETHFTISKDYLKTYAFYVRPDAGHAWDAEHTDEGVGGSEIAVINLSKELAQAGNTVYVFNRCHTPGTYDGVVWDDLNKFDEFERTHDIDILVVSRLPEFRFVNPKTQVYYWAHDLNYYERINTANWQYFDKFLVLSRYHYRFFSEAYPWIPKEMFEILPNGLDLKRFEQKISRNPKKLIYSSNPDRGLVILFDIFEELHKWDPELELHVFGYYPDNVRKHPKYWKEIPGVIYRGYHKQYELAAEYLSSKLWLYPCTWLETFCITALEAQAAGTPCIVSEWGPLRERVGKAGITIDGFNKDADHKKRFTKAIKSLLTEEDLWNQYSLAGKEQIKHSTWTNSAKRLMEISNKCRY